MQTVLILLLYSCTVREGSTGGRGGTGTGCRSRQQDPALEYFHVIHCKFCTINRFLLIISSSSCRILNQGLQYLDILHSSHHHHEDHQPCHDCLSDWPQVQALEPPQLVQEGGNPSATFTTNMKHRQCIPYYGKKPAACGIPLVSRSMDPRGKTATG